MHEQPEITSEMRAIVVDWVVEVHASFRLSPASLYLAVHVLDRYLVAAAVRRHQLQLVGAAALLVAAKYEETDPPRFEKVVYHLNECAYTRNQLYNMERDVLTALDYSVTVATAWPFILRFLEVAGATELQRQRAYYFAERCLQEHAMLAFRPTVLAAAAVYLARLHNDEPAEPQPPPPPAPPAASHGSGAPAAVAAKTLKAATVATSATVATAAAATAVAATAAAAATASAWPAWLAKYSGIGATALRPCAALVLACCREDVVTASGRPLVAVKRKYCAARRLAVATEELPVLPLLSRLGPFK
ncbi:unnamed protein product [Phaeothamnion confervicola]